MRCAPPPALAPPPRRRGTPAVRRGARQPRDLRRRSPTPTSARASGGDEPVLRFRNYEPASEDLASLPKVEAPVIPDVEEQVGTVRLRSS